MGNKNAAGPHKRHGKRLRKAKRSLKNIYTPEGFLKPQYRHRKISQSRYD